MAEDPIIWGWFIEFAAGTFNRYPMDGDVVTPYQNVKGRVSIVPVAVCGGRVCYQMATKMANIWPKSESAWLEGIYLGALRVSNGCIIGTQKIVVRADSTKIRLKEVAYDNEVLESTRGTPSRPVPGRMGVNMPIQIEEVVAEAGRDEEEEFVAH